MQWRTALHRITLVVRYTYNRALSIINLCLLIVPILSSTFCAKEADCLAWRTHTHKHLKSSGSSCPLQHDWTVQTDIWLQLKKIRQKSFVAGVANSVPKVKNRHWSSLEWEGVGYITWITWHQCECICGWSGIGTSCIVWERREKKHTIPHNSHTHTHTWRQTTYMCNTIGATMLFTPHFSVKQCKSFRKGGANVALKDSSAHPPGIRKLPYIVCMEHGSNTVTVCACMKVPLAPPFHTPRKKWQSCLTDQWKVII